MINHLEGTMTFRSVIKSAALGAGFCIFAIGIVLAQTAPAPAPAAPAQQAAPATPGSGGMRAARDACRSKVESTASGPERREAMRKCMQEARGTAGSNRESREARREKARADMKACREQLKDQRFTEAERRGAMQTCMLEKDPSRAKAMTCRTEAENKKLERGSTEFRKFMRECNTRS